MVIKAIQIEIENTYGNSVKNLREHFNCIHSKIKKMGQKRFEILRSSMEMTAEEVEQLTDILKAAAQKYIFSIIHCYVQVFG